MKKKLSCLLIAIAMLAGMNSCNNGAEIDLTDAEKYNMTLTLWLPTSEDTTDAAVAQVEAAINKITKKNYKTAIDITAIPEDEYDQAIIDRVIEVEEAAKRTAEEEASRRKAEKEAKKKGETLPPETTEAVTEAPIVTGEDGEIEESYPAAKTDQLDIFCIRGYDNFAYFAENGYLSPLDEYISASSKLLKSYVYPTFLEWGKIAGDTTTYAVPNSHVIGEYTYMLINKEQCDKLKYDPSELTALFDDDGLCQQFIEDVGKTSDITPLLGESWATGMQFWNNTGDRTQFSVLGSIVSDENDPTSRHALRNVLDLKQFNRAVIMMKELDEQGYIGNNPNETEFGIGIVTCDNNEISKYEEDYYINVLQRPRAETADIYQSMFGVSMNSLDVSRSMEIITLINTDPTVRTILQYGVEGKHWEYNTELTENGEKTIKIISNDYKMNLIDTGNVFLTYPGENIPMSYWEDGKQQNLDSLISPYLGFARYI
ncbi:MAG: extracellular solute-binding protein, partial [Clostridia bacterium]|nr:extracellular solute-binding protein [Clostridia bacterium]